MYNRLYSYLDENKLFKKQFGFRHGHSTEHALLELIKQIIESSDSRNCFLGIFIDLQKPLTQETTIHLKNYTFMALEKNL